MATYDVVTLGETMLRLTPPFQNRIEVANTLEVHVGGSESNVAVGLSRLGMQVCWVSRLTRNALGQHITGTLRQHGVDTSHVIWTDADRVGLYFLEEAPPPRGSSVIYDRAASAMSRMSPEDLPDDLFQPDRAKLLHLSGITPAISKTAADTAAEALTRAKAAGWLVSFDVNYRGLLWSHEAAQSGCDQLARQADLVLSPMRDAISIFGVPEDAEAALKTLAERWPNSAIVLTRGEAGVTARAQDGTIHHQEAFPVEPVHRIGAGDAFIAGFLYGYLNSDLSTGLKWGSAAAAMKFTVPGDMPVLRYDEVIALVRGDSAGALRR